jgi:hypothetical protein
MEGQRRAPLIHPFIRKLVLLGSALLGSAHVDAAGSGPGIQRCEAPQPSELRRLDNAALKAEYCTARATFFALHRALDAPAGYRQECEARLEAMAQIAVDRDDLGVADLEDACVSEAGGDPAQY